MPKRIVICADGTWNRPEEDLSEDFPTNVLRLARAVKPVGSGNFTQQVFYDWGVGSHYDRAIGGATGRGLHKNIVDDCRYIVQNYATGDEIYLFGFSRGAYTVRSLSGLINNCGILKRPDARLIQAAFEHYKRPGIAYSPRGTKSIQFRKAHSHPSREVKFTGVWDTVGAMGIPFSFLGMLDDKDEFYDTEIGSNVRVARHALAIDELRADFEPTMWIPRENLDLKQVWFVGAHSDVGGSYPPDSGGWLLSDITLDWMLREASAAGLTFEPHLKKSLRPKATATLHESRRSYYRIKAKVFRPIDRAREATLVHRSVKERWDRDKKYRPQNLVDCVEENGWPAIKLVG
jgi:uncharacterized protein (DUF2235 family)